MTIKLTNLLKDINQVSNVTISEWQLIIAAGREQAVLGRLYYLVSSAGLLDEIPNKVLNHLQSAYAFASQQKKNVIREIFEISNAFQNHNVQPILLKGAAYAALDLTAHQGRSFSDIDLLVPHRELKECEVVLMSHGWFHKPEEKYNQEYYRNWMHEIQPMMHIKRMTVLDLHHNLLPLTNKHNFDATRLNSVLLQRIKFSDKPEQILSFDKNRANIKTLSQVDLFIHCAIHLFTESEFSHPLRDITDLSLMLDCTKQSNTEQFINDIDDRANQLNLTSYVDLAIYYASYYSNLKLNNKQRLKRLEKSSTYKYLLLPAFKMLFSSDFVTNQSLAYRLATFVLYIRGHILRMPLKLLIPHLIKKAWMRRKAEKQHKSQPNAGI